MPQRALCRYSLADAQVKRKLARTICKFPTEWDASTIEQRWGWLKVSTTENPNAFAVCEFDDLKTHITQLAFFSSDLEIPRKHWHWHPVEFIEHFRKCGWISIAELAQIYPDSQYPSKTLEAVGTTPEKIRTEHLKELNLALRKYTSGSPIRRVHFLAQGAVESMLMALMIEGAASFQKNPRHPSFAPENEGYYRPPPGGYLDYLEGRLGNIATGDGPKFRGRGMKQLTGRENYSKYWVYRGWLDRDSFSSPWWNPARPALAPQIPDPERLSTSKYNAIDAGGWYWEAGAAANRFQSINSLAEDGEISDEAVARVTRAINGGTNGLAQRITQTRRIFLLLGDEPA